jgi:ABC-type multidrug transport system fused ATPase/permease subunit
VTGSESGRRGRLKGRLRRLLVPNPDGEALVAAAPPVPFKQIVRRFWPYARPYRRWIAIGLVFVVLTPLIETATIWMFKVVVDQVLVPRDFGPFVWIAAAYLGLTALAGAVAFADDCLATWVGERFLLNMRTEMFRHLQSLSLDFFERRRLGDVISRLTGDVSSIETFVLSGVSDALSYSLRILFFGAALFYLQWDLALAALIVVPLFWLAARHFSRLIKLASREKRRRSGSISAIAEESLANAALVQANNRQAHEVGRFHREGLGSYEATMTSTRIKALYTPLIDLIELLGAMLVIGLGTWELSRGNLSLGGLLVFMTFLAQLYSPVRGLGRLANSLYSASASAERIIEFLDLEPSVRDRPGARRLGAASGAVRLESVGFSYPGAVHPALEEISLEIPPGETLALVGPSGAGKSTIAKLLLRFYDPRSGRVTLDGHDLRDLEVASLRENIAVLLQETLVFDGTVRENIAYGRPEASEEEIVRAATAASADEFIRELPQGYETPVGQKGRLLSGGQRQRIAIARAMVRDAPVLILDEPTAGIDAESATKIVEPLRRLIGGRSTIVVSHNLLTVRDASSIAVLDHGRVVERGDHDELVAGGGLYARLHELHAVGRPAPRRNGHRDAGIAVPG